jgi:membrane carboxypeptidase/penicillin-binding protein
VLGIAGVLGLASAFWILGADLPDHETLGQYEPPTVTVVYDNKGRILGEIYEKRRYVIPLDEMPQHLIDAFVAAEDANFWTHEGVDPVGIFRAVVRNLAKGKKAQGASTITQQVARNFLLTREKTFTRKIKEMILARRVEEVFDKKHILYLYLNQIYLGSGAYGVEAAARTYFDKPAKDLTLPEAAILAGLPQRPSDYSPHRNWDKARARQMYVLDQMKRKDFIDKDTHDAALADPVNVAPRTNDFLKKAPHFTEYVRRYLVDTYGFDKIYNDGLTVDATCDLDLQKAAQDALVWGVNRADNKRGWRGPLDHVAEARIAARRDKLEQSLREAESKRTLKVGATQKGAPNEGGYGPIPAQSVLREGDLVEAIVLQVRKNHAIVGVGAHEAVVPLAWSLWAYELNLKRSHKYRRQDDLRNALSRGDVVRVRIEATHAKDKPQTRAWHKGTRGPRAAAVLDQDTELQGALFSYRLDTGAVEAMVGGIDYESSEYNRAIQSRRQVGSTFKPLVYGAAIGTRLFSVASMVQDAPTTIGRAGGRNWKPSNYGGKYLGNITLRRALAMSRNVCTVRVLQTIGPEVVYQLAGEQLGIGFIKPKCSRRHIPQEEECVGERTASPVEGMSWCQHCDPTSCPVARVEELHDLRPAGECMDEPWEEEGREWCHSCDVNIRACDWWEQDRMDEGLPCPGARKHPRTGEIMCRACDLSMGLGTSSLTMVELARAYSAFATYGSLIEPYWIERVIDRDGTVIEAHEAPEAWPEVMDPATAYVTHYLLRQVATVGTGSHSNDLARWATGDMDYSGPGIQVAGKTGTTNDYRDAWFVGYSADVVTAAWTGFDQPAKMGASFTGGDISLPTWMKYMAKRYPDPKKAGTFGKPPSGVVSFRIDQSNGRVVTAGGLTMPMLAGTEPTNELGSAGQKTVKDIRMEDY